MKLLVFIISAASLLFPSTASANDDLEDVSHGNGLLTALSHCPTNTSTSYGKGHASDDEWHDCILAIGYIRGVVDSLTFYRPEGVTYGQEFEIVHAYLKSHVNLRQRPSPGLIRDALTEAFPPPRR